MGETQNLRTERIDKYDSLKGRWIRDIKTNDIINIFAKASPTAAQTAGWDMVVYTTSAYVNLYPYMFGAHHCGTATCPQFVVLNDSTTAIAIQTDNNGEGYTIGSHCECPLMRVAESSTITIHVANATNTTDTYCAWIVAKREPTLPVVEDA